MPTVTQVQSAVYSIEIGRGKRVVLWVLTVLVAITVSLLYTFSEFRGLERREAMDMAQLARNIARGEGFTTYFIRPLSLWHLKNYAPDHNPRIVNHPDLYNPPLYPLLLAGIFKLLPDSVFDMGPTDRVYRPERWVILPINQILLLFSILLVYLWAKELFDGRVAVTAGLVLLFSDTLWGYSILGLPSNLLLFLWLAAAYCLWRADRSLNPVATDDNPPTIRPGRALIWTLAGAVLLGLACLTVYRTAFLILPLSFYVWRIWTGKRGVALGIAFAVVTLLTTTPWLVRNYQVSRSILGIAQYQMAGGEALERSYHPDFTDTITPKTVGRNLIVGLRQHLYSSLRNISADYLVCFFLVGLLFTFRRSDVVRVRWTLVGTILAGAVGMALIPPLTEANVNPGAAGTGNLFLLFLPLVVVFGTAFFYLLVDRISFQIPLTRALTISGFVAVNIAPLVLTILPPHRGMFPYPPYIAPYTRIVANLYGPHEIGASDMPWSMAWIGDRRTVWLPTTPQEFTEISDFVAPTDRSLCFLFVTPYLLDRKYQSGLLDGEYKEWAGLIRGQLPASFPLKVGELFHPQNQQLLISDRPRWRERQLTEPSPAIEKPKKKEPAPPVK